MSQPDGSKRERLLARSRVPSLFQLPTSGLILLALGWRLWFFIGPCVRDDVAYAGIAHQMLLGTFVPAAGDGIFTDRLGVTFPVVAAWKVLGITPFATVLYSLVCGLGYVAVAASIAGRLFGPAEAFLAALLMAFLPLDAIFGTELMPDLPMSCWIAVSIACAVQARSRVWWVGTGAALGLAALTKEFAVAAVPTVIVLTFRNGLSARSVVERCTLVAVGGMAVLGSQALWYGLYGNPFHYLHVVLANAAAAKNGNPDVNAYVKILFGWHHGAPWFGWLYYSEWFGWLYYFVVAAALFVVMTDLKRSWPMIVWALTIFVFLQWVGPWLAGRIEIERMERFLIPLSAPAAIILARGLALLGTRYRRWALTAVGAAVVVASMMWVTSRTAYPFEHASVHDLVVLSRIVPLLEGRPIFADQGTADKLEMLTAYTVQFNKFNGTEQAYPPISTQSWVISDGGGELTFRHAGQPPPAGWVKVLEIDGPRVRAYAEYNPIVFLAQP